MNREIKFRAWDNQLKQYYYPKLWDRSMPSNWDEFYTLEQYTGLKDSKGVDIYEGDKTSEGETVVYEDGIFGTTYQDNHQGVSRLSEKRCRYIEVIGNVHDNPELL